MFKSLFGSKPDQPANATEETPPVKLGLFARLKQAVQSTKDSFVGKIEQTLRSKPVFDDSLWDELETILIQSDIGVSTTTEVLDAVRAEVKRGELPDTAAVRGSLQRQLAKLLESSSIGTRAVATQPQVILVVGVNGTGKTTTIGRLAWQLTRAGKKVLLVAGDTFRAAAIEQLEVWGERAGCEVIKQKPGADPSAVIFDGLAAAKSRGYDVVIADTAGRLHTKANLMTELEKVTRTCNKVIPGAPHEVYLVMDATTGQNGLQQARLFTETSGVTGIVLTKLDGTAKGGVVIAIARELKLPIRYVGIGEQKDDLIPFDAKQFIESLFA
ncbi:MAG: signal recognition particle-docking protein FtsY [Acidobacteria bacterium]|nr:signal recognition particle-docking protein FtsY [Acidobacteriota bacterium]